MARFAFSKRGHLLVPSYLNAPAVPAALPTRVLRAADATTATLGSVLSGVGAAGGVSLALAPGNYGELFLSNRFNAPVILYPADPADPPRVQVTTQGHVGIRFYEAKNWTLDGWQIETTNTGNDQLASKVVLMDGDAQVCSNIRLTRCSLKGHWDAANSIGGGSGVVAKGVQGLSIDRCRFPNTAYGMQLLASGGTRCTDVYVGYNDFLLADGHSLDSIDVYGVDRMIAEWNLCFDKRWYVNDLHPDFFQFGDFSGTPGHVGQDERATNVIIRNNFGGCTAASQWSDGSALFPQTVWIADGQNNPSNENFLIEGNEFYGPANHGISLYATARRVIIRNNRVHPSSRAAFQTAAGGSPAFASIRLAPDATLQQEIIVSGNLSENIVQGGTAYDRVSVRQNQVGAQALSDPEIIARRDAFLLRRLPSY